MAKIRKPLPLTIEWKRENRRELYLDYLVKENKWTTGIEVGVRFGRTLFYLLENNPSLKMYAVDIDISQFYSNKIQDKYKNRLIVLEGDSSLQAEKIKEQVDFIFIDAAHSKKAVIKDLESYRPLVKTPDGLLGHDIDYPSIQEALAESKIEIDVCPDNVWRQKII
jgi:predicted O-methyltransferase YrrM